MYIYTCDHFRRNLLHAQYVCATECPRLHAQCVCVCVCVCVCMHDMAECHRVPTSHWRQRMDYSRWQALSSNGDTNSLMSTKGWQLIMQSE